jgi:hypothetical protein
MPARSEGLVERRAQVLGGVQLRSDNLRVPANRDVRQIQLAGQQAEEGGAEVRDVVNGEPSSVRCEQPTRDLEGERRVVHHRRLRRSLQTREEVALHGDPTRDAMDVERDVALRAPGMDHHSPAARSPRDDAPHEVLQQTEQPLGVAR